MTSPFVEPLPKRKRRKGPDEEITKNVVVLRSNQVCEMDGVVLMPKTTLDMSGIKKLGQSKKVTVVSVPSHAVRTYIISRDTVINMFYPTWSVLTEDRTFNNNNNNNNNFI